jgi:hypothetical protein
MHEEAELGGKHHQATIVLHEGETEHVFTESEVVRIIERIRNNIYSSCIVLDLKIK